MRIQRKTGRDEGETTDDILYYSIEKQLSSIFRRIIFEIFAKLKEKRLND